MFKVFGGDKKNNLVGLRICKYGLRWLCGLNVIFRILFLFLIYGIIIFNWDGNF